MIKNFRLWKLACLATVAVLIVSCGNSGADYRDALPADSFMTLSVNPESLMQKSGGCDITQSPLFARVKSALDEDTTMSAEEKEYVLSLLKNPAESGIDTAKDFFFFASMVPASMSGRGGLLLPIGDKAKFDDFIARINAKAGTTAQTENGVSVIRMGDKANMSAVCAYTDAAVMLYFGPGEDEAVASARKLLVQKRAESLMENKVVADQLAGKNDINLVLSYGSLLEAMNNPTLNAMPVMEVLKGATALAAVNFEQGRIAADAKIVYKDKEAEQKAMDFYSYVKTQKGDLLRYLPANSIGAIGFGVVGEKLYTMLSSMPGYGMLMANPMIKQVMDGFDGDFVVSFSGMAPGGMAPFASVLAQVKDANLLQPVIANLGSMPIQKMGENEYMLSMGGVSILFGVKDNVLYCTTDAAVKTALDGAKIESLTSLEKIFKGQAATFYLDFKGVNDLATQMIGGGGNEQTAMMLSVLSLFDNMECYGSMEGAKMVVNMVDKEQNALKTICDKSTELINQYLASQNM